MISNRALRIAGVAIGMWLLLFMAVPAASAQRKKRPPTAAGPSGTATIKYFCYSTDPNQPAVYLSGIFDLPDAGSEADNFMSNMGAVVHFQDYLVRTYGYPGAEDPDKVLIECSDTHAATTATSAGAIAARKQSVAAQAVAAKKRVVETGWKYTKTSGASAAANSSDQPSDPQVAQQGATSRQESKTSGTRFQWVMEVKKDALTNDVSTQPVSRKHITGANGKLQGFVTVHAYCSSNGVSIFFQADPGDKEPPPSFPWYNDTSRGDDGAQITDVRLVVDDRPVHVAEGFQEVDGHQSYANTLGLLFYEPHTAQRAVRDQQNSMSTGIPALDGMVRGIVNQTAQSNVDAWQSSAAGPLSDLVSARSIRIELQVTTFDPKPVLDLNPQDPVLHKFVSNCSAKFAG